MRSSILILAALGAWAPVRAQAPRPSTGTAHVTIVRARESTAQHTVLVLRVEGKGMTLGSYEGRIHFDPAVLSVDSAAAGTDGSRFVNAADASKGVIRFAGFTPTGFKANDAVRFVVHAKGALAAAHLTAAIEVAGDLDGRPVPKAGLIGASGVDNEH